MTWDERTLSALHQQHNPRLATAQVAGIANWVAQRCAQTRVDNPTALLVACLKRAQPEPEPSAHAPRQHRPDRSWRRDLEPMSDADRAASQHAMRDCLTRVHALLATPDEIVTHNPPDDVRG